MAPIGGEIVVAVCGPKIAETVPIKNRLSPVEKADKNPLDDNTDDADDERR
jgi:hypothetical protein